MAFSGRESPCSEVLIARKGPNMLSQGLQALSGLG